MKKLLLLILLAPACSGLFGQTTWTLIADTLPQSPSYNNSNFGGGVSFYDFDMDGWDDLTFATGPGDSLLFFRNNSGQYQKVSFGLPETATAKQVLWVDYDNDGDKDFFVANENGVNNLYRNDGNMNLTQVTAQAGLPTTNLTTWSAAFGDYDRDGWLDLYVANYMLGTTPNFSNYLYRNQGDGTFAEVTMEAMVSDSNKNPLGMVFFDYNNDNWPDIFIGQDKMHGNVLLKNNGDGTYDDVSAPSNANVIMCAMNAGIGDYNNDGFLDIYVTNGPTGNKLMHNNGNGTFNEVASITGTAFYGESWGGNFYDYDNDGDLDLYVSGAVPTSVYQSAAYYDNLGNGTFTELTSGVGMDYDTVRSYSNAVGDMNNDGFPELVVNNNFPDPAHLWLNNGTSRNWIKLQLQGTASNRDGVGSMIEVWTAGNRQIRSTHCGIAFLGQNSSHEIIGLDTFAVIDSVIIKWPSGHKDKLVNINANQSLLVVEGQTGPVAPQIFVKGSTLLCQGDTATLYTSRFPTTNWSNGNSTQWNTISSSGNYSVITMDPNNIPGYAPPVPVTVAPAVTANIQVDSLDCYGVNDGGAVLQILSGTGPFQVHWSDSSQSTNLMNVGPGDYAVMITDRNGCSFMDTISLIEPVPVSIGTSRTEPLCFGGLGSIATTVSGGTAPYFYIWSTGHDSLIYNDLAAGTYQLSVTDSKGCLVTRSIMLNQPDSLVGMGYSLPDSAGMGAGVAWVEVSGGTVPYQYLWDDQGSSTTDTVTGLYAGLYRVQITDLNGCMDSATVQVGTLTAIGADDFSNPVRIWPVPADNYVNISGVPTGAANVRLVDVAGNTVLTTPFTLDAHQTLRLNLTGLASGRYFLEVISTGNHFTGTLVIQHN